MKKRTPIRLADYRPPAYTVDRVQLFFDLHDHRTLVTAELTCRRAPATDPDQPCVLDGRDLNLAALLMDGDPLEMDRFQVNDEQLIIHRVPARFTLTITTEIHPEKNTSLEGLYRSGSMFCTQCEAQGFRKITYYPDRPDVLARFTTIITADKNKYPVLLANGNQIGGGSCAGGQRHYAVWEDPFPKPSYLFALVAGDLALLEDTFITRSGRSVRLQIYTHHHHLDKCGHAMASLKKAMQWDEETYGLEYDLDQYMIVAVDDFNMGAMENKGLNIFNTKYVLCRPDTATDNDYEAIEAVIAHEYFHNWTGNRVTCRDWFQLSLKEGLTVFRDQEFTADMTSRPTKRIQDVQILRTSQFREDASPLAHPVRPESYIEINNFYTVTVYEKGAELVRMLHTMLGAAAFRDGLRLYLQRHDGQAATIEDFVAAMAEAGGRNLDHFLLWYDQAGTPRIEVESTYDAAARTCTLTLSQHCPATPGQPDKKPVPVPVAAGLLTEDGRPLPLRLAGEPEGSARTTRILELTRERQSFTFTDIPTEPVPSLLRNFSAPVRLVFDQDAATLAFLFAHDPDPFNRWEAGQRLATAIMLAMIDRWPDGDRPAGMREFLDAWRDNLLHEDIDDQTYRSQLLGLPTEEYLADQLDIIPVTTIHAVRDDLRALLASNCRDELLATCHRLRTDEPYRYSPAAAGRRRLKNLCLDYLVGADDPEAAKVCRQQFRSADNMTDTFAALRVLVHHGDPYHQEALETFARRWHGESLVMDKWLAVQASAPRPDTLSTVQTLMKHEAFSLKNPNRVRALIGSFAHGNPCCFHDRSGAGYRFVADQVLAIDRLNPQTAARLATCFSRWQRYDEQRRRLMQTEMERILAGPRLSRDVHEVVSKSLGKTVRQA